jgi:hypothetical protein
MNRNETIGPRFEAEDRLIKNWLVERSIPVLGQITGGEVNDPQTLVDWGILAPTDIYLATNIITERFLGANKNFGDGWHRGGAESFYKIAEVVYRSGQTEKRKHIAFKAVHTMGSIWIKTATEAVRMALLAPTGRCGRVYAVGSGIIVKEFFESDEADRAMSAEEHQAQEAEILSILASLGLKPGVGRKLETIQCEGKLILTDLGSGDIEGASILTLIATSESF